MPTVTLFEYKKYPYKIAPCDSFNNDILYLSENTVAFLEDLNRSKPFLETGLKTIRPLNYVGVIRTGDLTIQIFPKLFSDQNIKEHQRIVAGNLLKMLSFTDHLPIKESDIADLDEEKIDLFEIFIRIFAKELHHMIRNSQKREYVKKADDLRVIKGKINFNNYNNPARLHVIPCEYYDFSLDNLMNRTLKYSCYLMSRSVIDFSTARMLKRVIDILDQVNLTPVSVPEIDRISFTRLNMMFEPFIRLCKIFLSHSTLTLQASDTESFSFLIPMEKLFEEFIAGMLKNEPEFYFEKNIYVGSQENIGYLVKDDTGKRLFQMRPDILIGDSPWEAIIDTKYKVLIEDDRKFGVSQADLYQMYAYAGNTSVMKCMLLYPSVTEVHNRDFILSVPFSDREVRDVEILIRSINLSRDLNNHDELEKFRNELRRIVKPLVQPYNLLVPTQTEKIGIKT
jgi:5-methylcytosine-specific restriction enzyme subunit McrC